MATIDDDIDDIDDNEDDGCGVCLPCRFRALIDDMAEVRERLRAGKRKEAESLLCVAIEDAERSYAEWVDEIIDEEGLFPDEDEDGDTLDEQDEFGLGNMTTAGRA